MYDSAVVEGKQDAKLTSLNQVVTKESCTSSTNPEDKADLTFEGAVGRVLPSSQTGRKIYLCLQFYHRSIVQWSFTIVQFRLLTHNSTFRQKGGKCVISHHLFGITIDCIGLNKQQSWRLSSSWTDHCCFTRMSVGWVGRSESQLTTNHCWVWSQVTHACSVAFWYWPGSCRCSDWSGIWHRRSNKRIQL